MLIELKAKGTALTALDQIKERRYLAGLDKYEDNTLLVGISYDRKTKEYDCIIEKAQKSDARAANGDDRQTGTCRSVRSIVIALAPHP